MKLRALIIEDEEPAAERLKKLIFQADPEIEITDVIVSIRSAVSYLKVHTPDLIFLDIHLADGESFDIFRQVRVTSPIIFTTAYDQFALQAFKLNSIDYILKPVKQEELAAALTKFKSIYPEKKDTTVDYQKLADLIAGEKTGYKKRLLIRYGDLLKTIEIKDAAYFYSENKISYVATKQGARYALDNTLDELEKMLEPKEFFRINRQFIVGVDAIDKMLAVSKSRVKLTLKPPSDQETIVSTERSPEFKKWLAGE
ncbi:MAG: LytTR family DNA-binding domain-containing protein [Bacteroidetes bacterium]|nr:LytTR family DNA-binding domain-containing protein [Bacteroidota bacterium]